MTDKPIGNSPTITQSLSADGTQILFNVVAPPINPGIGIVKGTPFTLPAGVTSFTVTPLIAAAAASCVSSSEIILLPRTPDAALEATFLVATAGNGMFEVNCANSLAADMIVQFLIVI